MKYVYYLWLIAVALTVIHHLLKKELREVKWLPNPYSTTIAVIYLCIGIHGIILMFYGKNIWHIFAGIACFCTSGVLFTISAKTPDTTKEEVSQVFIIVWFGKIKPYIVRGFCIFLDWFVIDVLNGIKIDIKNNDFTIDIPKIRCRDGGPVAGKIQVSAYPDDSTPQTLMAFLKAGGVKNLKDNLEGPLLNGLGEIIGKKRDEVIEDKDLIEKMIEHGDFPLSYWEWVTENNITLGEELQAHISEYKKEGCDQKLLEYLGIKIKPLQVILLDAADEDLAKSRTKRLVEKQERDSDVQNRLTRLEAAKRMVTEYTTDAKKRRKAGEQVKIPSLREAYLDVIEAERVESGQSFTVNNPNGLSLAEFDLQKGKGKKT